MRALYTAATGMAANQLKIENIANNIANSSTSGYKKVRESYEDLVYQRVGGASADSMQVGSGVRVASLTRNFSNGDTVPSSNATDMLIDGAGFFIVETPSGETLYTRDGHFRTDVDGNLTTQSGNLVSPGIQVPEGGTLVVGSDGSLSADLTNSSTGVVERVALGTLEIAHFQNPEALEAAGGNLYRATPGAGDVARGIPGQDGAGQVLQYATEGSNVDVAEELVNMITAQRSYEMSSKVIQAADEMLQTAVGLKR